MDELMLKFYNANGIVDEDNNIICLTIKNNY